MNNFEKYEKLKKLNEREESAERQLKKEKQRLKILQNQRKVLERKARTHRLCQHGALLERYFPPDEFTDEMIRFLMDGTFNRQDEAVRDLMEEVKDIFQSEEKHKTIADLHRRELAESLTDVRAQLYTTPGALRSLRGPGRTGGLQSDLHCDE